MYVRMPDLCNMVQPMDYSFKEISIMIKKNLALLANEHWVVRLHRPTSDSVTGGKLRHYRTIKADPNSSPYLLGPVGPGQRWVVGSLRAGCLPLVVETGRYRSPKVLLVDRVCTLCDAGCVEDEIHFITTCRALHNEKYIIFTVMTLYCTYLRKIIALGGEARSGGIPRSTVALSSLTFFVI